MSRQNTSSLSLLILLVLAVLQLIFSVHPAAAASVQFSPAFTPIDCPFPVPPGLKIQCGYLEVLEDRALPAGSTIRLMVAILKSTNPHPQADPLIFLQGGPGSGAVGLIPGSGVSFLAPFLTRRDVILFDQRGTGLSDPTLNCPLQEQVTEQYLGKPITLNEILPHAQKIARECRETLLARGIRLEAYNSTENAADIEDLRLALGYEQVNLYGLSYGTRLALTVIRDHPQGLRSVILNSTFPPSANIYRESLANTNRAFETLFQGCQEDWRCRLAYPKLRQVFYELVDRLNAQPVTVQVPHPRTNELTTFILSGVSITSLVYDQMYNTGLLGRLPALIYDASEGEYTQIVNQLWSSGHLNNALAIGMALSVFCREEAPFAGNPEQLNLQLYPEALQRQLEISLSGTLGLEVCKIWNVPAAPLLEEQPVTGSIPTLVLAGQYDPVTPPAWGQATAQSLENGVFYEFPGVGHGVMAGGTCPQGMMMAFLNNPTQLLDASCIAIMPAPKFTLRAQLARPWVGFACLLLLAILGWTAYRHIPRLWRQRAWLDWSARQRTINLLVLGFTVLLIALALRSNAAGNDHEKIPMLLTARVVETIVSLMFAIQVSQAFSPEDEPGMEILLACPRPPAWLLLERLGPAMVGQTLVALVSSLIAWNMSGGLLLTALLRWIPPTLFMSSLALYMNMSTRRSAFSLALSVLMWWAMSFMGSSLIQRWPVLWPLNVYMQPEDLQMTEYILNRLFVTLAGSGLLLLSARILQDEERTLLGISGRSYSKRQVIQPIQAERNSKK